MDLIQFEQQFEKDLVQIQDTPWNVLKLKLIKASFTTIQTKLPKHQQSSYLSQLIGQIPGILLSIKNDAIDPQLLDWAYFKMNTDLPGEDYQQIISSISKRYFSLGAMDKLADFLSKTLSLELSFTESGLLTQNKSQFLSKNKVDLPQYLFDALSRVSEKEFSSSLNSVNGLFVVKSGNESVGVVSKISIEKAVASNKLGLDQVRIATHLVDESDIFAEQTKSVCSYLHNNFNHEDSTHVRLEYTLDQPSSLLVGSSAGLAFSILGQMGLSMYKQNHAIQPRIYADVAITGSVDDVGNILPVSNESLKDKIEAAFYSQVSTVIVPKEQLDLAESIAGSLSKDYPSRELNIIGLSSVVELNQKREIVHYQRRRVSSRINQFVRDYANSVTYSAFGFIILLGLGFWFGIVKHPIPESLISEYGEIIVRNKYNFELFRVQYTPPNNDIYHSPKNAIITDIDMDDIPEVLVGSSMYAQNGLESTLACYNRKGEIMWRFEIRPKTVFGENTYFGTYNVGWVFCDDLNQDGQKEIVVTAGHLNFPQVIYTLNANGEKVSEYWNSGHWSDITIDEIYVSLLNLSDFSFKKLRCTSDI